MPSIDGPRYGSDILHHVHLKYRTAEPFYVRAIQFRCTFLSFLAGRRTKPRKEVGVTVISNQRFLYSLVG